VSADGLQKVDGIVEISQKCIVFLDNARDRERDVSETGSRVAVLFRRSIVKAAKETLKAPERSDVRLPTFLSA